MTDHRPLRLAWLQLIAASLLLMVAAAAPARGQDSTPPSQTTTDTPPDAADAEPAKPEPIAAADIAPQAEDTNARLRDIDKLADVDQATSDITEQLPESEKEIQRLAQDLTSSPPVSLRGVAAARQHWTALDDRLGVWQEVLQKRTAALQLAHDELESKRGVWQVSQTAELPETVLQQIDSVLKAIDTTETAVSDHIKQALTLQGKVSKQRDSTSKALGRLDEIEASQRSTLFVRDQDPLWQALASDRRDLGSELTKSTSTLRSALSEFLERYKTHVGVHTAIFIILIIVIWLTRSTVSAGAMSDSELERVSVVLARPFATALLISLLLMRFLYPIASSEILQIARIIVLAPMLRLLPRMIPRFRWMLVILSIVFISETAAQLAAEGTLVQRLVLLATTTLAIGALSMGLVKSYRESRDGRTWTVRLVCGLGWLGVLGLLASLIANILGTMALASLLGNAMFNSIWAAVVLRVAINVLSALLILILRSPMARGLRSVRNCSEIIHRRVIGVLQFGGILMWTVLALSWLQLAQPIGVWWRGAIEHEWTVGSLQISVLAVASFIIAIAIAVVISKIVRFFLEEDVLTRLSLPRGAAATISTLVNYSILGIGVLVAFAASGMDLSKLGFILGALSVGIGFGLQNIVNNFVSGLILIFERPVKVGDLIELKGAMGNVTRIGARSSTVRTFNGAEVIVPNGNLIASEVINWTLSDQKRRTEVFIPVPLGTDSQQVTEILVAAAKTLEDVLDDPEPHAAFQAFEGNGMVFGLRAWPSIGANILDIRTDLVAASLAALHEAGIDAPQPQREVRLVRADGEDLPNPADGAR